jgi:HD-GYP domain-containing protein (c-di-GMP phosphodiesterase class II)
VDRGERTLTQPSHPNRVMRGLVTPVGESLRLVEPLAALSRMTDLARGRPDDEAMRACLLATELGRRLGLARPELVDIFYTALLRFIGCTATSHEYATTFGGDDIAVRRTGDLVDAARPREGIAYLFGLSRGRPGMSRALRLAAALPKAKAAFREGARADCEVGALMARRISLSPGVERGVRDMFERWDGLGLPQGLRADAIALPARVAAVAYVAIMVDDSEGIAGATDLVRRWSGRALDPVVAGAFVRDAPELLAIATPDDPWAAVVGGEPGPGVQIRPADLDEIAATFGDAADLKAPFLAGHSSGVARLAAAAAETSGLLPDAARDVRRAGHLHDLGRAAIPSGIWEKSGRLTRAEWEQVRLHAYYGERILASTPVLANAARIAGLHQERVDGSGYHRGARGPVLDDAARLLAAADTYQALVSDRPHRAAFSPEAAGREMGTMPLDRNAVAAVLAAAGQAVGRRRQEHPAGLTEREVEVLRLLVAGRSLREISGALFVSPSTAHTHVAHIYEKAGVSTRAGAAMFAMQHDLVRVMSV